MIKKAFSNLDPDRRSKLLSEGLELYVTHPFEEVTIRMIAEKLGINMATFYRYFTEKEDFALTIYEDIISRYLDQNVNIFRGKVDESSITEEERSFLRSIVDWPDYMYRKLVFESEIKFALPLVHRSLQKERLDGNLRNNVVEDFVAYLYCTMEYNLWCYCKANNITDEETLQKLGDYMDRSLFMEGIMLPEEERTGWKNNADLFQQAE